jgi:glycosyltransferase involved in cell wall biosynthesis
VVNEAMLCGRGAVVSDHVGAGPDLVLKGQSGCVFPCGDVNALSAILRELLSDPHRMRRMGEAARSRMDTWTPQENIDSHIQAFEKAVAALQKGAAS